MFNPMVDFDMFTGSEHREGDPAPAVDVVRAKFEAGNAEYMTNYRKLPHNNPASTRFLKAVHVDADGDYTKQAPWAAVLCCADSRAIPEDIFGQPRGRLFVIRTAGNTLDDKVLANMAYALRELNVPLLIVMGHEACGAVEAAVKCARKDPDVGDSCELYRAFIDPITPAVLLGPDAVDDSVRNNIARVTDTVRANGALQNAAHPRSLEVDRVYFNFQTGEAEFF